MATPVMEALAEAAPSRFLFSTGIECSYPTVAGPHGRSVRVDELEKTFHYRHWQTDLALVRELGLRFLRYGPPYYRVHAEPERYDWEFTDLVFREMQRLGLVPIADLCHFGLPDWAGSFQNPDWPELFARFAGVFAARYPWVRFYTPVNEIYACAKLSTLDGIWNERERSDRAFVTALRHLCRANLLAVREILRVRPDAIFIQSESAEYFHLGCADPEMVRRAEWENERRFLSFDLLYSVPPSTELGLYLLDHGMPREELQWFMRHELSDRIVMGNDYYQTNEHIVAPGGDIRPAGEVFGWSVITRQYFDRYRRPVMHTETNVRDVDQAPRWLWKEFFNVRDLRRQGVPVIGFTWYSLVDQVDWDSGLALNRGVVNPLGLFDLDRRLRPVGEAYRELIQQFGSEPLVPGSAVFSLQAATDAPPPLPRIVPKPQHAVAERPPLPERAQVAISRTTDEALDDAGVEQLVREALRPLGGLERFIRSGQTVLIKPNLTMWRVASSGVTTDPRVVAALARIAREAGAAVVQVGECSSCGQVTREVMQVTGMEAAARAAGAEPVYFDEVEQVEVEVPLGRLIHRIPVPKPLLEADVVIACPKLKTHFLDPITGALKLWVGAARQDTMHRLHRDCVQETVADLLTVTRPDLAMMDALIAGEGNGPVATRGRWVGCILASDDPVALDVVAGDLSGFDGAAMSFPRAAAARGIGIAARERIDVLGVPVATARVSLVPAQVEHWTESYPVRVIAGEGVTMAGTLGHFKGFADVWQADHLWEVVVRLKGKPTFLIGRAEDPDYEAHLQEGPYFVLDDAALEQYKRDPRVTFIPGSPIGNEMMPAILQALGIEGASRGVEGLMKAWEWLKARRL
ncbi:MAG: family 1 glycosylhydrolase [Armatimonadota bacterium]